jgi:hypothetical protein
MIELRESEMTVKNLFIKSGGEEAYLGGGPTTGRSGTPEVNPTKEGTK